MKKHKPHWYRIYLQECVLCGLNTGYKERVYGKKPEDYKERYIDLGPYACCGHFL